MSTQTTATKTHEYIKPKPSDHRSPCPALNALANHGYINRDGKNINVFELIKQVHNEYNISNGLASVLAFTGMVVCWDGSLGTLDLHELARHNRIEHNYSLVHKDAMPNDEYAPTEVDKQLLVQLLGITEKTYLTKKNFVAHRENIIGDKKRLGQIQEGVSSGETCMILDVFGVDKVLAGGKTERGVPKNIIEIWMGDERLPTDCWKKPSQEITFTHLKEEQDKYESLVKKLKNKVTPSSKTVIEQHLGIQMDQLKPSDFRSMHGGQASKKVA